LTAPLADHARTLAHLADIAEQAGRLVLEVYATAFQVDLKGPNDPVTLADHRSNDHITAALARSFPGVPIVAEESDPSLYAGHERAREVFFVDPLDGTREFVARNGEFVIMIGLAVEGRAALGVVHAPARARTWAGAVDGGATERGGGVLCPIHVRDLDDLSRASCVVSRSRRTPRLEATLARLGVTDVRPLGSAGCKAGAVATGEVDAYVHLGRAGSLWDTCAPEAVVRGAGGRYTHEDGAALDYATPDLLVLGGIVAAGPRAHARILEAAAATR